MKILLLILICSCFFSSAKSQLSLLGKSEKDVLIEASGENFFLKNRSVRNKGADSLVILEFFPRNPKDTAFNFTKTLFIRNEVCKGYMITNFISALPNFIQAINSKYRRVDDTHWIDSNAYYQATLNISKDVFSMFFEKL